MYATAVTKTLALRIDAADADDFESAAGWAAHHWNELGFGTGTPFWVEAAADDGRDAVIAQGVEGEAALAG